MQWTFRIPVSFLKNANRWMERHGLMIVIAVLSCISVMAFMHYYHNGLGIAYNDARSHLDIGRRVVEGLKPGIAQLGSVWLPLTHLLMGLTIWNDFFWHSGLAGAIESMIAFVGTGVLVYLFLKELKVGLLGRFVGVVVFVANINILYLQSTAMTELPLLGAMTAGAYFFLLWYKDKSLIHLIVSGFWIMLATLIRYDGWFLFFMAAMMIVASVWRSKGYRTAEGMFVLFCTLGGFGIFLWLLWNLVIFHDPLYFAFGPYSAHTQQEQLLAAGMLPTEGNWFLSAKMYLYALAYNSGAYTLLLGLVGSITLFLDKKLSRTLRFASFILFSPLFFNVLALYLGHSVLFIQGLSGDTWFNVRYGVMMMPSIAVFVGYLAHRAKVLRPVMVGTLLFVGFFMFSSGDAVTIDDARVGSSQKNVGEVSGWLHDNTADKDGFILISAASHDAIIFSSGLPMKKFIHEGTGAYWEKATEFPDRWARWIVLRTHDDNDLTYRMIKDNSGFQEAYTLVDHYPFADIYELKPEYLPELNTKPILGKQK